VEATRSAKRVGLAVLPMLLLAGLAAQTSLGSVPAPKELRVLPREEALLVRWRVTSSEGLAGFRVRYRPVAAVTKPWSASIKRPATARSLTIAGLRVRRYEVMVRAVLSGGRAGGMATAIGKPRRGNQSHIYDRARISRRTIAHLSLRFLPLGKSRISRAPWS